jgi:hypothetical protein
MRQCEDCAYYDPFTPMCELLGKEGAPAGRCKEFVVIGGDIQNDDWAESDDY